MTSVAFASVSTTSTRRELDDDDGSQRRRRFGRRTDGERRASRRRATRRRRRRRDRTSFARCSIARSRTGRARERMSSTSGRESETARASPGVVARRDVEAGTTLVTRSVASTAFDATYARECASNALTRAIEEYEGTVEREMSDDAARGVGVGGGETRTRERVAVVGSVRGVSSHGRGVHAGAV